MATEEPTPAASWTVHKAAGNAAYSRDDLPEAVKEYSAALASEELGVKDRAIILANRAQVYLRQREFGDAVSDCTASLTLVPDNVKSLFRRATALEALGNKADAIKDYKEVVRLDPTIQDALLALRRLDPSSVPKKKEARAAPQRPLTEEEIGAIIEAGNRVKTVERQVQQTKERKAVALREKKKDELTIKNLEALPADTRTFQAIGKMFLLKPKEVVEKRLADNVGSYDQTDAVCTRTLGYLESQLKDASSNLEELLKTVKSA